MNQEPFNQDNEIGRRTFFWYRVYLAAMVFLYSATIIFGIYLLVGKPATSQYEASEMFIMGALYTAIGVIFFVVFAAALFLPRKPWNWIVGIVMMAIGMTSCCFVPFLIPLLIYWLKPETKAYFGRSS